MKNASRILALAMALAMLLGLGALADGEPAPDEELLALESIGDMRASSYTTLDTIDTRAQDAGHIYVGYDVVDGALTEQSNWTGGTDGITLGNAVVGAGFTAVRAAGAASDVTVNGGTLVLMNGADDADGEHASDFTGTGAAFVASGGAKLTVRDLALTTDGFVRAAFVVDSGAIGWLENANIVTYGANPLTSAYDGYVNSADTSRMISPPWVLGIQGGIRTVNVLGTESTLVLANSSLTSGGWGVVSTDGCTNPVIYFVDSALRILPETEGGMSSGHELFGYAPETYGSGYGSYVIGNVDEYYYGTTVSGATFGAIAREGNAVYASSNGPVWVKSAKGEDIGLVEGKGNPSVIDAVFGVMTHSGEDVSVSYTDGTIVNSDQATVLYRTSGHADFLFDRAVIRPGNGVIVQMIDDDDTTVGMGDFSTMGFNTAFHEDAGLPSRSGNETGATEYNSEVNAVFTNGHYEGDLYNGTGYYGQEGDVMNVTVGEGAVLTGAIALTETFHGVPYSEAAEDFADETAGVDYVLLDEDYEITRRSRMAEWIQFTDFTIDQYYMLCRMENRLYSNGYSAVNVTVDDGGVWVVADESLITCLNVADGTVYGTLTENADGTLTLTPSYEIVAPGVYGTPVEANVAAGGASGEPSGEMSGEPSGEGSAEPVEEPVPVPVEAPTEEPTAEPPAMPSEEPTAEPEGAAPEDVAAAMITAAAPAAVTEDDYKAYLKAYVAAVPAAAEHYDEFAANIDAGNYYEFPVDMCFTADYWGHVAMSYDEFVAAGGVYEIPSFDVTTAD